MYTTTAIPNTGVTQFYTTTQPSISNDFHLRQMLETDPRVSSFSYRLMDKLFVAGQIGIYGGTLTGTLFSSHYALKTWNAFELLPTFKVFNQTLLHYAKIAVPFVIIKEFHKQSTGHTCFTGTMTSNLVAASITALGTAMLQNKPMTKHQAIAMTAFLGLASAMDYYDDKRTQEQVINTYSKEQ